MDTAHTTPDGSPVAAYLAMPAGEGPALIHDAVGEGASILELGCGAGRLTRVLVGYGHPVVAVDDDPEMLRHVTGAETVRADLFALDLDRRFDAVVAASHLINHPTPEVRVRLLRVCRRHVAADGVVLVERLPPGWAADPTDTTGSVGPVEMSTRIEGRDRGGFAATTAYRLGTRVWRQHYSSAHVDDDALAGLAEAAGLRLDGWLDDAGTWALLKTR